MTRTQLRTFMTFYNDELAFGAIPFDWVDPLFEEPAEVQFDTSSRYQITPLSNKYFRVSMAIEINP